MRFMNSGVRVFVTHDELIVFAILVVIASFGILSFNRYFRKE